MWVGHDSFISNGRVIYSFESLITLKQPSRNMRGRQIHLFTKDGNIVYYNGENDIYILERNKMARKKTPPKKSRVAGEIKKLQRSEDLLIGKAPFCRLVRGKWLILSF